jgi:hypothetical protein
MHDTMTDLGVPRKVLRKAHALGVHNDCLAADAFGACQECFTIMMDCFHFFYGYARDMDEFLTLVIDDLNADRGDV